MIENSIACPHCGKRIFPPEAGNAPSESERTKRGDDAALKALKGAQAQAVGGTCSD